MHNKLISLVACLIMLPLFIFGQTVNVTTDRLDATYEAGESMNFIVTGGTGSANYVIHYDHGVTPALERGTIQLGGTVEIPFTLDEPGTVICLVVATDGLDVVGATFSPFEIEPYEDDPADFDAFWEGQKSKLAAIPLDPQITPITTPNPNTTDFRISLGSVEGRRLYGYVSIPNNGTDLPAVITHSAFGVGPNLCVPRPEIADELGAISMSIWMHDAEPDTQAPNAYEPMAWDNRDSIYFRFGVLGILRAMDYIQTMPEFRGDGIILNGVSEGGGMSLITAGIDDRVTAVSASIFAHAEHTGFRFGRASGFPHYLQQAPLVIQGVNIDDVFEATKYYDVLRAAKRFEGPVLAAIGYEDLTSIPMAQFGAYNQLNGPKTLIHKTEGAHQNPDEFFIGKFDFYRKALNMSGPTNFHADAGPDQMVSGSATLTGLIEKGGTENTSLPVEWEMVSGPARAIIASASSRSTTVNFTADGEYLFRIRATDQTDLATTKTFYTFSDVVKVMVGSNINVDNDGDGIPMDQDCDDSNPLIAVAGDACDDGDANTDNDVIQADCSCAGTTVDPCASAGGDADGDGFCADDDCDDSNPNISQPGDACDDGDANTNNDVIQADCSCAGTTVDPCASAGGDADGDGFCADDDCDDSNPNISQPGDACDDGDANTNNDVIQADCSCAGTTVDPCASAGGDADGDGFCADDDCDDSNPNISQQGDACDDGDANTNNDVIQADCSCAGSTVDPCASAGGDADGDGFCADDDCDDSNPNISQQGDACDDGDANTNNDVIQADCSCAGSTVDPCASAGGDADGDGFCAEDDCDDSNPNISQPGDACDDGDANTNNDVIQADCSCAGTTMPPPNNNCTAQYQLDGNTLTVSQLTDVYNLVNIYDRNFAIIQSCQSWGAPCNSTEVFILPDVDLYFVQIQSFSDWNNQVCNIFEALEVQSIPGCDNVTDGGMISGDEIVCVGETPNPITSDVLPSGGAGTMEYQWISSTNYCPFEISSAISGATQSAYTPGQLFETTYFRRLSRREGCTKWDQGNSNCIIKVVETCSTPPNGCEVDYSIDPTSVSFSNLTAPIASVKIINSNGDEVFSCGTPDGNPCPEMSTIQLTPELYNLFILTAENYNQGFTCNIVETFQITTLLKQSNGNNFSETNPFSIEKQKYEFSVFPNPAKDEINLIFGKNTPFNEVIIFNQMGQIVKRTAFAKNPISVSELPSGIYFIKVGSKIVRFIRSK